MKPHFIKTPPHNKHTLCPEFEALSSSDFTKRTTTYRRLNGSLPVCPVPGPPSTALRTVSGEFMLLLPPHTPSGFTTTRATVTTRSDEHYRTRVHSHQPPASVEGLLTAHSVSVYATRVFRKLCARVRQFRLSPIFRAWGGYTRK